MDLKAMEEMYKNADYNWLEGNDDCTDFNESVELGVDYLEELCYNDSCLANSNSEK